MSRLNRVLGDWHARKGDGPAARAAYARAMAPRRTAESRPSSRTPGAGPSADRPRSSSATKAFDRAWSELRSWQEEYPVDKARGLSHAPAGTLLGGPIPMAPGHRSWPATWSTVNPDSPYADRARLPGRRVRGGGSGTPTAPGPAIETLLADYPGSPLVGDARKRRLAQMSGKRQ